MKEFFLRWLLCYIMLTASGCSQKLGDFTVLTTKNVDLSNFSTYTPTERQEVRGEDVCHIVVCFPNKPYGPNFKDAVDIALEENNAYMLANAVLRYDFFYIPLIYGQEKFTVEGEPVLRN